MTNRKATLAKIHIAKKDLGLNEDDYRFTLEQVTGHKSCGDMTDGQLDKVLNNFKTKGWKPKKKPSFKIASKRPDIRMIYALWWDLHRDGKLNCTKDQVRAALQTFIKNRFSVENPEWLPAEDARSVIEALKAMSKRKKGD